MRNRGEKPDFYYEPDPDAEKRWKATDDVIAALQSNRVLDAAWDIELLRNVLDAFWRSAYECAIERAREVEHVGDELRGVRHL